MKMVLGKVAWIVMLILQIVIRYPYRNSSVQKASSREEKLLLVLIGIGGLLPLIYIFTDWLSFADYNPSGWVIGAGIVVMVAGLWLFWRSHADLGNNWSSTLEIHDEHTLVSNGVYQTIRHPMYAANWLMMIAQALLLSNWVAGLSGLIGFAFMYFLRVPKEEQMMLSEFGEQYQQYMTKTKRIIPNIY
jgi:protein-S-isoprenylcysteine O-methyltransferase Ste14